MESLLEAFSYPFFQRALLAAILASIACGLMGTFVVVKKVTSLSGGVSHAALGGVGLGYFFGFAPMVGASLAAVASALFIGRAHLRDDQSLDTLISIVWALGMALGILLISLTPGYTPELSSYLFGSILLVPWEYLYLTAMFDLLLICSVWAFYIKFQAVAFDQEFARIRGVQVQFYFMLLLVLTALTIVILIKLVGVVLLIALLTIPSVIARSFSPNIRAMMVLSSGIAVLCSVSGLVLAYLLSSQFSINTPCGPLIVLVSLLLLCVSKVLRSRN